MLKLVYNYSEDELNKLVIEGDYKYLSFSNYKYFKPISIADSEYNVIARVSVDEFGNILGYFSAQVCQSQRKVESLFLVKFKYKYEEYSKDRILNYYNKKYQLNTVKKIARDDLDSFINEIMDSPIYTRVEFSAITENPANELYMYWVGKYGGQVDTKMNHTYLEDGKLYGLNSYWFDRTTLHKS